MFGALLHHISQYTSIGDCGQSVQSENRAPVHPRNPHPMLMGRRGGYVMAGDVCVICSAPSGSSVINLANQTNPDINYSNLIGPSNLNAVFKHIQYFILAKCCLLCTIREIPAITFRRPIYTPGTELDFCYAKSWRELRAHIADLLTY